MNKRFNKTWDRVKDIPGWLTRREAKLLCRLARDAEVIVEIGSYEGKSTLCLASSGNKVYSIDPHPDKERYNRFLKNALAFPNVRIIRDYSYNVIKESSSGIDLLFIDGDHSYEAVKRDFEDWFPRVKDGGVMAFHDCLKNPGVQRLMKEIMSDNEHIKKAGIVDSVIYFTKTDANGYWDHVRNNYILFLRDVIEFGIHLDYRYKFPVWIKRAYKRMLSLIQ